MKIISKSYLPIVITALLFLIIYLIGTNVSQETIRETIKDAGSLGIVVFILLTWTTYTLAPLSGTPFMFAGFYLYGQTVILYTFIAMIIASISNFLIAKIWGRKLVIKLAGAENLEKIDNLTKNYGYQSLFLFRIFLSGFSDVISYAFGLTPIKFKPYFIISFLGMIPGTIIWYLLSLKINNPLTFILLMIGIAYVFLVIFILYLKVFKKKTVKKDIFP